MKSDDLSLSRKAIVALIVVPTVAAAVGILIVLKMAAATTMGPDVSSRAAPSGLVHAAPPSSKGPIRTAATRADTEIESLRIENVELRRQLAAAQNANHQATAPKLADDPASELIVRVRAFSPALLQKMIAHAQDQVRENEHATPTEFKVTDNLSVVGVDVQRTQSLVDPIVGVIKIKNFRNTSPICNGFDRQIG